MTPEKLVELAKEAMTHAYIPYSGYKVGAALLCADGTVYQGCNIENASFTPTVCAERTAFFKAVYDDHRDFKAIALWRWNSSAIRSAAGRALSASSWIWAGSLCFRFLPSV